VNAILDAAVDELAPLVGRKAACQLVGRSRASHYRARNPRPRPARPPRVSPRALRPDERERIVATLNGERFCDLAPAQVWARLLDEDGTYLCSISTMYRLLRERHEVRERRRIARHPAHVKPELVATGPNQVWSWDITKLKGPYKWSWFHLYVILDVYSRYAVGWTIAPRESATLAQELIVACLRAENIARDQLTIHADRGSSMTSKPVVQLLADLGVVRSHSRPRQSNDNPYSEAQFKTLKYFPTFPDRFTSLQHARTFCDRFFAYYNLEHRHSGIGLHTPADVHTGRHHQVRAARQTVLDHAYRTRPERFRRPPRAPTIPDTTWINRPSEPEPEMSHSG
jgi:putative transposase